MRKVLSFRNYWPFDLHHFHLYQEQGKALWICNYLVNCCIGEGKQNLCSELIFILIVFCESSLLRWPITFYTCPSYRNIYLYWWGWSSQRMYNVSNKMCWNLSSCSKSYCNYTEHCHHLMEFKNYIPNKHIFSYNIYIIILPCLQKNNLL
jgi:hypothetical protein